MAYILHIICACGLATPTSAQSWTHIHTAALVLVVRRVFARLATSIEWRRPGGSGEWSRVSTFQVRAGNCLTNALLFDVCLASCPLKTTDFTHSLSHTHTLSLSRGPDVSSANPIESIDCSAPPPFPPRPHHHTHAHALRGSQRQPGRACSVQCVVLAVPGCEASRLPRVNCCAFLAESRNRKSISRIQLRPGAREPGKPASWWPLGLVRRER